MNVVESVPLPEVAFPLMLVANRELKVVGLLTMAFVEQPTNVESSFGTFGGQLAVRIWPLI